MFHRTLSIIPLLKQAPKQNPEKGAIEITYGPLLCGPVESVSKRSSQLRRLLSPRKSRQPGRRQLIDTDPSSSERGFLALTFLENTPLVAKPPASRGTHATPPIPTARPYHYIIP